MSSDDRTKQRALEFKYRFSQALVFGLPVLALEWFGPGLGPPQESRRWIAVIQALLCGWIIYIAALGMLVDAVLHFKAHLGPDLLVAAASIVLYLFSLCSVIGIFVAGQPFYEPLLFHWIVIVLVVWTGIRCIRLRRHA